MPMIWAHGLVWPSNMEYNLSFFKTRFLDTWNLLDNQDEIEIQER